MKNIWTKFTDDNFIQDRRNKVYTKVEDIVQYLNNKIFNLKF